MRIAQRLPSGAWHFVDARAPHGALLPTGNTDLAIDGMPPGALPRHAARPRKEWEALAHAHAQSVRSSGSTWDKSLRSSEIAQPPPAYTPSRESVPVAKPGGEGVYEMRDVGGDVNGGRLHVVGGEDDASVHESGYASHPRAEC